MTASIQYRHVFSCFQSTVSVAASGTWTNAHLQSLCKHDAWRIRNTKFGVLLPIIFHLLPVCLLHVACLLAHVLAGHTQLVLFKPAPTMCSCMISEWPSRGDSGLTEEAQSVTLS